MKPDLLNPRTVKKAENLKNELAANLYRMPPAAIIALATSQFPDLDTETALEQYAIWLSERVGEIMEQGRKLSDRMEAAHELYEKEAVPIRQRVKDITVQLKYLPATDLKRQSLVIERESCMDFLKTGDREFLPPGYQPPSRARHMIVDWNQPKLDLAAFARFVHL